VVTELKSILAVRGKTVVRMQILDAPKDMRDFLGREHRNPGVSGSDEIPLQTLLAKDSSHARPGELVGV
jgi:hypothetical protein